MNIKIKTYIVKSVLSYVVIILSSVFLSAKTHAATAPVANGSAELMCKNKAKEIAAEMYKNCVTEVKQTQIKSLRSEYEKKLTDLKKYYEKELKKIAHGSKAAPATAPVATPSPDMDNSSSQEQKQDDQVPAPAITPSSSDSDMTQNSNGEKVITSFASSDDNERAQQQMTIKTQPLKSTAEASLPSAPASKLTKIKKQTKTSKPTAEVALANDIQIRQSGARQILTPQVSQSDTSNNLNRDFNERDMNSVEIVEIPNE